MSIPRAITGISKEDTSFSRLSQPPPTLTIPNDVPVASTSALRFINKITDIDIKYSLFTDELVTFTDGESEKGVYKASAKRSCYKGDDCILVEARSEGKINGVLCGTEVIAYLKNSLETVHQELHETVQLEQGALDRRTVTEMTSEGYLVKKEVKQGEKKEVLERVFDFHVMEGYVSEAANIVLQRIMITKGIPDYFDVVSFDADTNLCLASYKDLSQTEVTVEDVPVRCYGIERRLHCVTDAPVTWHTYLLPDGHLVSRAQVGSPILMRVAAIPALIQHDEHLPVVTPPRRPLDWRHDLQLSSMFLERRDAVAGDCRRYLRDHPEVQTLVADFLQALLAHKPDDVVTFAASFFCTFSNRLHLALPPGLHSAATV